MSFSTMKAISTKIKKHRQFAFGFLKQKLIIAAMLIILASCTCIMVPPAIADTDFTKAEVFIIELPDVGASWVDDTSDVTRGAIMALNVTGNDYERANVPLVHPMVGKSPPFYGASYHIVSDWNTYKTVVESTSSAIIVNTHGEVIPVPTPYSREGWVDEIAEAMLERRMIWTNIAGYPFFYSWLQGQTSWDEWGENGFQKLTEHIDKPNVLIPYLSGAVKDDLTFDAAANLNPVSHCGWKDIDQAERVARSRPVYASDFQGYVALQLWGDAQYYTGAVIAFVRPGQRFDPQTSSGFGAFVHIGTDQTYHGGQETNADVWRAYVGTAAAIWSHVAGFEGKGEDTYYSPFDVSYLIHVTPVVVSYQWDASDSEWEINLGFFVIGALKRQVGYGIGIDTVLVEIDAAPIDGNAELTLETGLSEHGTGDYSELSAQGMWVAKAGLFALSLIDPTHITTVIGGIMLYADWISAFGPTKDLSSSTKIEIEYYPEIETSTSDGYEYLEFQTLIATKLKVSNIDGDGDPREPWRILPLKYHFELIPETIGGGRSYAPKAAGRLSIATYYEPMFSDEYTITAYHQDFQHGLDDWFGWDQNPDSGIDYWGLLPYNRSYYPHQVWCAGNTWQDNWPFYDKNMNAHLQIGTLNVGPYKDLELSYHFSAYIRSGDYLKIFYFDGSGQHLGASYTDCTLINTVQSFTITSSTSGIRFTFISNSDDNVDTGVFITRVEIRGKVPNDANSLQDAGESFDYALSLFVPQVGKTLHGYLEDEDWYVFDVVSHNSVTASFCNVPQNTVFHLEIWDSNGRVAGPSDPVSYYVAGGDEGVYAIRVFSEIGFGQYTLSIDLDDNSLPVASDPMLSPSEPSTTDDLHGDYTYYDEDNDQESGTEIRWYKDEFLQSSWNDTTDVSHAATSVGEEWWFTVRPKDGNEFGDLVESPHVTIRAHDVAVTNISFEKTVVGLDYPMNISVTVENEGDFTETFGVTVYANAVLAEHVEITLNPGEIQILNVQWNTSGCSYGDYAISANATTVVGETDTEDNTLSDGWILVSIPGDIDGDHDVDIFDIVAIGGAYGTQKGDPGYIPNCDINEDGAIDISDAVIAAGHYGQSW